MARIILKCPYLKGGSGKTAAHLDHLVKYIATRDGVEKVKNGRELWHATNKQQALVEQILREFPSAKELFEYEDYLKEPNRENASELITIALEQHLDKIGDNEKYLDYIANRPRVEKIDSHGLFTAGDEPLILNQVAAEISSHTGRVWVPIISLRREDAARFGYDNAPAWKALLSSKAMELAENLKIHPDHLKWYAAFHNESHHPHVHMICYSTDPTEGYLTRQGIRKMKSSLAREIFRQELIPLYREKTRQRDDLKEQANLIMRELIGQMKNGVMRGERIEQLIVHLADRLQYTSGKKQYGYLKADLKNIVDEIVDELAQDSRVSEAYRLWWENKAGIETIYTDSQSEPLPLSQCEDFKPIRNMVIKEALLIQSGTLTFEEPAFLDTALPEDTTADNTPLDILPKDEGTVWIPEPMEQMRDGKFQYRLGQRRPHRVGVEKDLPQAKQFSQRSDDAGNPFACYQHAKMILSEESPTPADIEKAFGYLKQAVNAENPYAAFFLGKLYQEGQHVSKNTAEAVRLFRLSAERGNEYAAYRLGKLYLGGEGILKDMEAALHWLSFAAEKKNQYAEYALGVLYLKGEDVPKDTNKALDYLKRSAARENQFAQYRLGKLYLIDDEVAKDVDAALRYLNAAAEQGNQYAQYTLGKLHLMDKDVPRDHETAIRWFTLSASQGNIYAQFFLDHIDQFKEPSILLAGTRLLHHLSRVFSDNAPPLKPIAPQIDRKRRLKLSEKKRAAAHARGDHEQSMSL